MNLKNIQEKLNEMFNQDSRQLVFWYDDKTEFCDEIKNLELDNAKIYHLKKDNWLYTKYFLEIEDPDTNYLIYAPFPQPEDKDNYLADMVYYATPFSAEKISLISQELNIPNEFKHVLEKYPKFWNANSRVNNFRNLNIEEYDEETIIIAILCVLTNVKVISFDEVLKKVLTEDDLTENRHLVEFKKMDILNEFWELSKKRYGYIDQKPTIEKFLITLVMTYTSTNFKGNIPKSWEVFISSKYNNITVFVSNLMNNTNYKDKYDNISNQIAQKMVLEKRLKRINPENYFNCDTFEIFDVNIIAHLTDLLVSNREELPLIYELLDERQTTHFYKKFEKHYEVIKWANFLIKMVNEFTNEPYHEHIEDIISKYSEEWSFIDRSYRNFYYYYDQISDNHFFQKLRDLIENMYTNTYLSELAMLWSDKIEKYNSITDLPLEKQFNFYKHNVTAAAKKQKTAVIISDGFRYECATELKDKLDMDPTRKSDIKPMMSCIPSVTALGMACLLPNKKMEYAPDYKKIIVDDKPSSGTSEREKILETNKSNSKAIAYDNIVDLNMARLREELKTTKLLYIYHNQIDARGDNALTENEVFKASKEAITEIIDLVKKLTNEAGIKNYFITADHGFIYKRDKLNESDKVDLSQMSLITKSKRYLLSKEELSIEGTSSYLGLNDVIVTVPRGVDVFKVHGAGQNYVHGGSSIQEVMLPLLNVKTKTESKNQDFVELNLISINNRITNLSTILTFAQKEKCTNRVLPVEVKLYFEDENGEKISNEVFINADKKSDSAKDREFKEKFTLRNRTYSKSNTYYLVMKKTDNDVEINRYEFTIDIAILDDFDF